MKYKCLLSENVFSEDMFHVEHTTYESYYGVASEFSNSTPLTLKLCPCCHDDNYEELKECPECHEFFEELVDTEGKINGGIGDVCEQCCIDRDIPL